MYLIYIQLNFIFRPTLLHYCDIETIMSMVRMLKSSHFPVECDYPRKIQEAYSKWWPTFKEIIAIAQCPKYRQLTQLG